MRHIFQTSPNSVYTNCLFFLSYNSTTFAQCVRLFCLFVFFDFETGSRGLERGSWMTSEVCTMFPFVWLRALSAVEEKRVILARAPNVSDHDVNALCQLAQTVRSTDNESDEILSSTFKIKKNENLVIENCFQS